MKKALVFFFILIILAGAIAGGVYLWYQDTVYSRTEILDVDSILRVEEGQTLLDIAPTLVEKGLLVDETILRIYIRLESPEINFQAGTYQIPGGMNIPELIEYLNLGPQVYMVRVTIPEGLRKDEVSETINKAFSQVSETKFKKSEYDAIIASPGKYQFTGEVEEFLQKAKVTNSLEGFLFPDTYNLGTDATALDVINLQLQTLITRLADNEISVSGANGLNSFAEVINLSSIVEREAQTAADKKMIGDIFLRRLEMNWTLGADAPILYPYGRWTPPPTLEELESDDPYNSRKFTGLPPTPIANPGIDSILGVVAPTANDYLYFISDPAGKVYYAVTFEQHQINIANYL